MLTSKQRAYLRGIANSIDTIIHVGKGGISDEIIKQADDALISREIIKGK
ncbi:MAG: YhbY family RNA-binding protein, partial [Oscillospiraceae bacterium]|nr:YhbY family RNA-binding protein [Oscillospiraceae bacterium]